MKALIFSIVFILTLPTVSFGQTSASVTDDVYTKKELKKIIIYGNRTCHYCVDTKTYLTKKRISFVFYDLDIHSEKIEEMYVKLRKSGISTSNFQIPVVDKGGKIITNNYKTFDEFLSKLTTDDEK
ncbi:glutaredoxin family protein [uncultured Algibacter sp.]|uniref:glutaredoxin family protein n=1 Tax=uncultured Algibacter sp. TaxID=298659 RepID=UPI00262135D1|nr:glutaredoxin family protein [uncultured Algibacter sp.]